MKCEEGYLCDVCGGDVEEITDSDLYLRYVIGLTRQGLLHNLAMLTAGRPPDHADGGVAEWVEVVEPQLGPPEVFGEGQARPLEFAITVSDQPVGHATLWLDDRGLPIERRQVVNFPEGQMRVTERYTEFVVVD